MSIEQVVDVRLCSRGLDSLDDIYGPLRAPFGRIYCELCRPSMSLANAILYTR